MGILEIDDLHLNIGGTNILNGVNMDVWEGHIHALVGPNGAGKSTLAFAIMGMDGYRNVKGDIVFEGESLTGLDVYERARKGISLAWQEPARYEGLTVKRFLDASSRDGKGAENVLNMVGMEPERYLDRAMDSGLSGGERKKIELASIMNMDPDLVMLDEPDSGIDVQSLENIFDAIQLLKERGTTVILITHSPTVLKQAEHSFLMCCGSIVDKGTTKDIDDYFEDECIPCDHKNEPEEEW